MIPLKIENFIGFYMFICISLLIFNLLYMFRSNGNERNFRINSIWWSKKISKQLAMLWAGKEISVKHQKLLQKRLRRVGQLTAFHEAIQLLKREGQEAEVFNYLRNNRIVFQYLASEYAKKNNMEKAYYAYLMSIYQADENQPFDMLMELLIGYMYDSTIYCRENVLRALYAMGNIDAVEKAYTVLYENKEFHHAKLLADGLLMFRGDRKALAERLWKHHKEWHSNMVVALISFISSIAGEFSECFFQLMQQEETNLEIRLAVIRYFRKQHYAPVEKLLQTYAKGGQEIEWELTALSATALQNYPSSTTIEVLLHALHDRNWYVRHNAAASLIYLNVDGQKIQKIIHGTDRYAKEMLEYMIK